MAQMTLKIKKVGMKNPKTKVLGFASRAIANGTQDFADVCELAGLNTTMNQAELEAAGKLIMQAAVRQLKDGKAVSLGPLGKIRPAVSGKWVEKAEDLTLADLTPKLNYVPSDELKAAISGAKLGWTTEAGTDDDEENGGDNGGEGGDNTGGNGGGGNNNPPGELEE